MNKYKTDQAKELVIGGKKKTYPIYEIKLDDLKYNIQNDRIVNKLNILDGIDSNNIEELNNTIEEFIWNDDIEKNKQTKNNIEKFGQLEAGIVTFDGIVIDGNRRFTCLRKLKNDSLRFKAIILEDSIDLESKMIKTLELQIQHGIEEKLDYNPINKFYSMYRDIQKDGTFTIKEYANYVNMKEKDIKSGISRGELIDRFLIYSGNEGNLDYARSLKIDGPISDLDKHKNKLSDDQLNFCFDFIMQSGVKNSKLNHKQIRQFIKALINNKDETMLILDELDDLLDDFHDTINEKNLAQAKNDYQNIEKITQGFNKIINRNAIKEEGNDKKSHLENTNQYLKQIDIETLNEIASDLSFEEEYQEFKENIKRLYGEINE